MEETVQTDIDPRSLIGSKAFDRDGAKIGTVDEVYLDDATGRPEWAAVRTGLFGRDAFVPLEPSEVVDETLRVPFTRTLIKDAPDFGVGRHLSPEQELQLYHHYGLEVPTVGEPGPPAGGEEAKRVAGAGE
ncbi:PRC-barrel domain-containing protein [Streptomyces sp. TRM70308]|uniref:PRC-barrel domain-containing protein n=1 Tax=Streptomyces sp. TRM70308 TaxID=3131932 RepID=UPI003D026EDE